MTVVNRPGSYDGTERKCWTCGAIVPYSSAFACFQCGAFLCSSCHKSGLCPDHFALLSNQQQIDIHTYVEARKQAKTDFDRPMINLVLPMIIADIFGFGIFLALSGALPALLVQSVCVALTILSVIVGIVVKVQRDRLRPPFDRANLAIQALLDDVPALAQVRPVCRDPLLIQAREEGSGEILKVRTEVSQAIAVLKHLNGETGGCPPQEIPIVEREKAIADWKDFVDSKYPCLYCPNCKINHPAYARYCIFCGKPLPKRE